MQDIKETQKNIENYYDDYVIRQKKIGVTIRHRSILKKSIAAGLQKNHRVLELGCGIGTFSSLLASYVNHGKVVAMDISSKSIEIAKNSYQKQNIEFIYGDVTLYDFSANQLFDCIILPDVLEHIPIELHDGLFKTLSNLLKPEGFIFIHIPDPSYLQWCHENRPDLLQVIDQPITTDILVKNTYPHDLIIEVLKSYTIRIKNHDYQYVILRKKGYQDYSKNIKKQLSFMEKLRFKLKDFCEYKTFRN